MNGFNIGDIIINKYDSKKEKFVITKVDNEFMQGFNENGEAFCESYYKFNDWKKTNVNYCEIEKIIKRMKGE